MSESQTPWRIEGNAGLLTCGPLEGRVEFDGRGVRLIVSTWNGQLSDGFGAMITAGPGPRPPVLEAGEQYVRGRDLVASYVRTDGYPFAPHFYWRATHHASVGAVQIEMILSVQTDLLDSHPEASIHSFGLKSQLFAACGLKEQQFDEVDRQRESISFDSRDCNEHLLLFRNEAFNVSYAELFHPSDFVERRATLKNESWFCESVLFPERLEKGVIRRARISGWFLPAENDLATAVKLARQFIDEPLPLTA